MTKTREHVLPWGGLIMVKKNTYTIIKNANIFTYQQN